jgi:hypothetical protein
MIRYDIVGAMKNLTSKNSCVGEQVDLSDFTMTYVLACAVVAAAAACGCILHFVLKMKRRANESRLILEDVSELCLVSRRKQQQRSAMESSFISHEDDDFVDHVQPSFGHDRRSNTRIVDSIIDELDATHSESESITL